MMNDWKAYWAADIEAMNELNREFEAIVAAYKPGFGSRCEIKNVIFNPPATIVFWKDNTKTVVKCGEHDEYDPEKGLAMAFAKKIMGNHGNYYNIFRKWLPENATVPTKKKDVVHLNLNAPATFEFSFTPVGDGFKESINKIYGFNRWYGREKKEENNE